MKKNNYNSAIKLWNAQFVLSVFWFALASDELMPNL